MEPFTLTTFTSHPDATAALAAALTQLCQPGDVILLEGELGAGKTAFARGVAQGLGLPAKAVSSPTFGVMHIHQTTHPTIKRLLHVDAYRLTDSSQLDNIGWDQGFDAATRRPTQALAVIEWPSRIADTLPPAHECIEVMLSYDAEDRRKLIIRLPPAVLSKAASTPQSAALLDAFATRPPLRCPTTHRWVLPTSPSYPFFDERAQQADLYRWLAPIDDSEEDPDADARPTGDNADRPLT